MDIPLSYATEIISISSFWSDHQSPSDFEFGSEEVVISDFALERHLSVPFWFDLSRRPITTLMNTPVLFCLHGSSSVSLSDVRQTCSVHAHMAHSGMVRWNSQHS